MKKIYFIFLSLIVSVIDIAAQPQAEKYAYDLSYFLPMGNYTYNQKIPTPESVLGFQIGQQHVDWGEVVKYMEVLANTSNRIILKKKDRTYQHRQFIEVIFTSEKNRKKINDLKEAHFKLTDADLSESLSLKDMPVIVSLIYSIHGNEPSGVNASFVVAYFLAAAQGKEIENLLDNIVIIMTPGANPDGINRFASWVNTSRSLTDVSDPNSREFLEPWPSSRTNHYWADCNRDWLMAQHPEGINALNTYFSWLPNVVVDLHEHGAAHAYYFSPGDAKRTHPLTPKVNQDLTAKISSYCAMELDKIGTGYYSKEGYDDYYYGKGASYGDIHGSVCLLYEQGTSRGHFRMTVNGVRSFASTIRNQVRTSYATLIASYSMKDYLLIYQKEYYKKSRIDAKKEKIKGYVFDTRGSKAVAFHFLENMAHHRIDVYHLAKDYISEGKQFKKEDAYIIPVEQKYSTMVKVLMENSFDYIDSTFYDISSWTFPHAFNLKYVSVKDTIGLIGHLVIQNNFNPGRVIGGQSNYGYIFENTEFYAPKVIYELQKKGLYVNVSGRPFMFHSSSIKKKMNYGTVQILVQNQPLSSDEIYDMLVKLSKNTGVDIYAVTTGLMEDIDLGSPSYRPIKQPKVAILVGRTMGVSDSGEIWYLLDKRFQMSPVLIENNILTSNRLHSYNVIVIANGVPDLSESSSTALKEWIANGGTLIATGQAYKWVKKENILDLKTKDIPIEEDSTAYLPYQDKKIKKTNVIPGVILNCHLDKTHPLAWGLDQNEIAVIKKGDIIFKKDVDPYISPLYYTENPLLSGCLSLKIQNLLKGTPAIFAKTYKMGRVIVFADDMNFRSYWFGTSKLFLNAVFFRECIK